MVVRARNERVRKMRDKTIDVLLQMGVPASIKGFTYICDAIELFDTILIILTEKSALYILRLPACTKRRPPE